MGGGGALFLGLDCVETWVEDDATVCAGKTEVCVECCCCCGAVKKAVFCCCTKSCACWGVVWGGEGVACIGVGVACC